MISNIKKIILLINLLNNREFVTRDEVSKLCGIEERTFYRYVNILSENNIPIYFDTKVRGYRLSNRINKQMNYNSVNDLIIQSVSLLKYKNSLHGKYKDEIEFLLSKIISLSNFNLTEILNAYKSQIRNSNTNNDEDNIIKSILIDIAVMNSYPLLISFIDSETKICEKLKIENPCLIFNEAWILTDQDNKYHVKVEDIEHIIVL